jgi:protein O-mannosyl-transferase
MLKTVSAPARKEKKNSRPARSGSKPSAGVVSKDAVSHRRVVLISVAVLLAAVFLFYANALANGFVFDDQNHALGNRMLRSLANIPAMLTASYRPLRDISYALDFAVWGERAFGFHLTNILIHAANTLMVFVLVRRMSAETLVATFAALIFALHPLQTDAVTYISGRRDVLFTLFYLLSFYSYLRFHADKRTYYLGMFLGFFALALMSKEMAVTLPGFIFVWNFCSAFEEQKGKPIGRAAGAVGKAFRKDWWLYAAILLVVPAYAYYMIFIKGGSTRAGLGGFQFWGGSFYTNILTALCVHGWYLKQLVFPTPIVQYFGAFEIARSLLDWRVIASLLAIGSAVAGGFALLGKNRLMAFAILSYFVVLLPVSHIIPHHELLADHYLYLPMMSFGLFLALAARRLISARETARKPVYAAAVAVVLVFGVMTFLRNFDWKDGFTLWQVNYREVPNSIRAVSSLAGVYANRDPQKAIDLYKRSIEIDPSYSPAYVSLAVLLQSKEKAREAEQIIAQGLALPDQKVVSVAKEDPREFRSELTTALALAKGNQGDNLTSEQLLLRAIDLYPANPQPYRLLAKMYHDLDAEKHIQILKRHLAYDPSNLDSLNDIAFVLVEQKRLDEAIPYLERILLRSPGDFFGNFNLGNIYRTRGDCGKGRAHLVAAQVSASTPDEKKAVENAVTLLDRQCK